MKKTIIQDIMYLEDKIKNNKVIDEYKLHTIISYIKEFEPLGNITPYLIDNINYMREVVLNSLLKKKYTQLIYDIKMFVNVCDISITQYYHKKTDMNGDYHSIELLANCTFNYSNNFYFCYYFQLTDFMDIDADFDNLEGSIISLVHNCRIRDFATLVKSVIAEYEKMLTENKEHFEDFINKFVSDHYNLYNNKLFQSIINSKEPMIFLNNISSSQKRNNIVEWMQQYKTYYEKLFPLITEPLDYVYRYQKKRAPIDNETNSNIIDIALKGKSSSILDLFKAHESFSNCFDLLEPKIRHALAHENYSIDLKGEVVYLINKGVETEKTFIDLYSDINNIIWITGSIELAFKVFFYNNYVPVVSNVKNSKSQRDSSISYYKYLYKIIPIFTIGCNAQIVKSEISFDDNKNILHLKLLQNPKMHHLQDEEKTKNIIFEMIHNLLTIKSEYVDELIIDFCDTKHAPIIITLSDLPDAFEFNDDVYSKILVRLWGNLYHIRHMNHTFKIQGIYDVMKNMSDYMFLSQIYQTIYYLINEERTMPYDVLMIGVEIDKANFSTKETEEIVIATINTIDIYETFDRKILQSLKLLLQEYLKSINLYGLHHNKTKQSCENINKIYQIISGVLDGYDEKYIFSQIIKSGLLGKKIGRNDNCLCGSGMKYKKCCL